MKYYLLYILPVCLLFLGFCENNNVTGPKPVDSAENLPLLRETNKIGIIKGFNPTNPPATTDSINQRWAEALASGMSVGRLQIDWPELEPEPNVYNLDVLEDRLIEYQNQGLQSFLLISAYDSDGPVIPQDLQDLKFDDPTLINRFNNLMDVVIPILSKYDGYMISITNEADNNFGEVPNLHSQILKFLQEAKSHIHDINNEMAVTITLAEGSLDLNKPGIKKIIDECDVACWNFYGSNFIYELPYYTAQKESEIKADVQRMLNLSGNKNIVIQELGMWSGGDILDSSERIQRDFFEIFFEIMEQEDKIVVAYVFQLVDWSPEVTKIFTNLFEDENLPEKYIDAFSESLETMGLIKYEDGTQKLAWNTFIKWVKRFKK
ncbi:MAG: hypothetical protein KGY69_19220 [Bacteroidales bacterium]|nr:hypothetical protein [Bacteroidales bacterium]